MRAFGRTDGRGGFGSQTAADPPKTSENPLTTTLWGLWQQLMTNAHPATSERSHIQHYKAKRPGFGKALSDLQQPVYQNGRVHVLVLDSPTIIFAQLVAAETSDLPMF